MRDPMNKLIRKSNSPPLCMKFVYKVIIYSRGICKLCIRHRFGSEAVKQKLNRRDRCGTNTTRGCESWGITQTTVSCRYDFFVDLIRGIRNNSYLRSDVVSDYGIYVLNQTRTISVELFLALARCPNYFYNEQVMVLH